MSWPSLHNTLSQFQRTNLREMESVLLMDRVDIKYAFPHTKLEALLPLLKDHYKVLDVNGKLLSRYDSLYFDDEQFTSYNDHHRSRPNRFKVRYRKYVDSGMSFLEVKHRRKGRTNKLRIPSSDFHEEIPSDQMDFIEKTMGSSGIQLAPKVYSSYTRITLVGKEHEERLTLDIGLSYRWEEKNQRVDDLVIAELKQHKVSRYSPFARLMKSEQVRPFRLSKYCIGVILLYGTNAIKYNRFKKKLLKIEKLKKYAA